MKRYITTIGVLWIVTAMAVPCFGRTRNYRRQPDLRRQRTTHTAVRQPNRRQLAVTSRRLARPSCDCCQTQTRHDIVRRSSRRNSHRFAGALLRSLLGRHRKPDVIVAQPLIVIDQRRLETYRPRLRRHHGSGLNIRIKF